MYTESLLFDVVNEDKAIIEVSRNNDFRLVFPLNIVIIYYKNCPNTTTTIIAIAMILHNNRYALRSDLRFTLPSMRSGTTNQRIKLKITQFYLINYYIIFLIYFI